MSKFFAIVLVVQSLLVFYLYRRFAHGRGKAAVGALVAAWALVALVPLSHRVFGAPLRSVMMTPLYWLAYTIMGVLAGLVIYSLIFDLFSILRGAAGQAKFDDGRRKFLTQSGRGGLLAVAAASGATGFAQTLSGPQVKEVEVPIAGLPRDLAGFRIVQISDLHIGPTIGKWYVDQVVAIANSLNADLIALTGDIVDGTPEVLRADSIALKELKARHGVFFCTGNHEFFSGVDLWMKEFSDYGFHVLENSHETLKVGAASLVVAGVHDYSVKRFRPEWQSSSREALKGARGDVKILLAHQPRSCFEALEAGCDLQLSGHTHAGQFFPFSLFVHFAHPYVSGLNRHEEKMWVYVNQATGYWGPPIRTGLPPEITLLKLKA